eukprot:g3321.t1
MNPSVLAPISTAVSTNIAQAASRSVQLYRRVLRSVPTIKNVYDIEMSTEEMRDALTARFRSNAEVSDPRIVDMLVSKGTMELEETLLQFKTKPHVMKVLEDHSATF